MVYIRIFRNYPYTNEYRSNFVHTDSLTATAASYTLSYKNENSNSPISRNFSNLKVGSMTQRYFSPHSGPIFSKLLAQRNYSRQVWLGLQRITSIFSPPIFPLNLEYYLCRIDNGTDLGWTVKHPWFRSSKNKDLLKTWFKDLLRSCFGSVKNHCGKLF